MNNKAIAALLALNILVTGGLGALLILEKNNTADTREAPSETAAADTKALEAPLAQVSSDIRSLNSTVQRFSTSYVQYDFLKREMDALAVVDRTIGVRSQATAASKTDENAEDVDKVLGQLNNLSQQVKTQLQDRRQKTLLLIRNLEQRLAKISGTPVANMPMPETAPTTTVPPVTPPKTNPPVVEETPGTETPE